VNSAIETTLLNNIKTVLFDFPEYWDEETLLKNKVIEDLRNYDEKIITALLNNKKIKETYALSVGDMTIFKVEEFIEMLRYKSYWENSYTKYRNEIGLTADGKYLNYNTDIVLDFPFKDCVLEGGMSNEDEGRNEVYYHNVIAKEEIDTLLSPKVLTNMKKYDEDGEHKITEFNDNDNLIMKGNNLLALHTLKERYNGKVKFIYIDPPYNTGSDSFKYNDKFNRSTWLTFMKNRLEIAKELLSEDGIICVQINDNEAAYLKVLMDKIYGRNSYLNTQYIRVRYADKTLKQDSIFHKEIEQLFMYKKNENAIINPNLKASDYAFEKFKFKITTDKPDSTIILGGKKVEIYNQDNYEIQEIEGSKNGLKEVWATGTILDGNSSGRFFRDYLNGRYENDGYGVLYKVWDIGKDQFNHRFFTGPKRIGATKGKYYQGVPVDILDDPDSKQTKPIEGFVDLAGSFGNIRHEGGINFGSGKKPEILIHDLIAYFSNEKDIVMDYFMGSGTTPAVAHKMNRQYIGIEKMDYIKDNVVSRLQSVIKGKNTKSSKIENWQGGGSFVYAELDSLNQKYIDKLNEVTSEEELESILKEMMSSAYLNFKVELNKVTVEDEDFSALSLDEKKKVLIDVLDMNQLYLNYSEIDDTEYDISDEVKQFNHSFYGQGGESIG